MSNQPRHHHYVPRFYLSNFTDNGTSDGSLHVLDTEKRKTWSCKPKAVAHQRDFYRIENGPDGDPMFVEKALGKLEGQWSIALRDTLAEGTFGNNDRFSDIMIFIAFLAVRVPGLRNIVDTFVSNVKKNHQFAEEYAKKNGWQSEGDGEEQCGDVDKTWHVKTMLTNATLLPAILADRHWCICSVAHDAPDLICSDWPVSITPPAFGLYPTGFATKGTLVTIPIHKRHALVGSFEFEQEKMEIGGDKVAFINAASRRNAVQLYSSSNDFTWLTPSGTIGNRSDLIDTIGQRKQS
ncbi:hypothetical protein Pan97_21290 [Bremerella volcania]|uniref:DUF4238 domain-containing protein n=1 Tax=Bremerella volcania TaxID=2527984 RepID=A0A518C7A3_9BACT|nr:DUF4238 domain-containing protein [Bremerella volcania]QDU75107.1 hypothetical protein Pan97_21290 [Bremerella volcania]